MKIFYGILLWLGTMIYGYLIGSISFAVIISKYFKHMDVRDYGSHNAGGTNVGRVLGKRYGALVIFLDMVKTAIAIWSSIIILRSSGLSFYYLLNMEELYYYPLMLFISIGHCFPIFSDFRGGKAVSTFFGALLSYSPLLTFFTFLIFFLILKMKKYVSLSAMLSSLLGSFLTLLAYLPHFESILLYPSLKASYIFFISALLTSLFLILRHKENIQRLKQGKENKIRWMK